MTTPLPNHDRMIEVADLLPPDLAKEMTTWAPAVQTAVLAGLTVATDEIERHGLFDPVAFERIMKDLAFALRRRAEARWREMGSPEPS